MSPDASKLLIVDDDPALLRLLEFNLSKHGYRIFKASDGNKAIEIMEDNRPDLIVTDIMMPVMDGYELLKNVRDNPETSEIPVIMLTAKSSDMERIKGLSHGADDFLPKPFNINELALRVNKLLSYEKRIAGAEAKFTKTEKLLQLNKEELAMAYRKLENLMVESLEGLITALEAKDHYTRGHSERVANYAGHISLMMHVEDVDSIVIAARLHDIGKIGISDTILNKNGKLTDSERDIIQSHPIKGAQIIEKISFLKGVVPAIQYHHERYDGLGFPEGLRGEAIPLSARIISVADTFDAMRTVRPYREAMPIKYAINELKEYSGKQFDPDVVDAFIRAISNMS